MPVRRQASTIGLYVREYGPCAVKDDWDFTECQVERRAILQRKGAPREARTRPPRP